VWTADVTRAAARVRAPTLVVQGARDSITPPPLGEDLARAIPGAQCTILPAAFHLLNIDAPDAFNQLFREHLMRAQAAKIPLRGTP
jgi:pimeloyl-ACP methyl ester carboxylesterase